MRKVASHHRRARRTVLCGIGLFVILQLLLSAYIHLIAPESCDAEYALRIASYRRRTAQSPAALTVFVLGSSRTFYGLQGEEFERRLAEITGRQVVVCNLGNPGGGPVSHLLTTQRLLADGIRPDLMIVEVLPGLLAGQVPLHEIDEGRIPTKTLRHSEVELLTRYGRPERQVSNYQVWLANLVPCHNYRIELVNLVAPRLFRYDYQLTRDFDRFGGHEFAFKRRETGRLLDLQRESWMHYLHGFELGQRQTQAVRETIDDCREAGVSIALLVTPEGPEFQSWYQPGDWEKIDGFLATLANDEQIPVINGHDWLNEDAFVDSHHMLAHGAREFSLRLAEHVWAPLHRRDQLAASENGEVR
jgi:hypothetical protein